MIINLDFVDKIKEKLHKRSLDEEIDSAFSDSYSKRVLESSDKYSNQQLSKNYMMEKQQPPPKSVKDPNDDFDTFGRKDNGRPEEIDDPFKPVKGADAPAPRPDTPLQQAHNYSSSDQERKEFFGNTYAPQQTGGQSSLSPTDMRSILLEMKDLRAQNEHIIDLLKNIQDRLRGY